MIPFTLVHHCWSLYKVKSLCHTQAPFPFLSIARGLVFILLLLKRTHSLCLGDDSVLHAQEIMHIRHRKVKTAARDRHDCSRGGNGSIKNTFILIYKPSIAQSGEMGEWEERCSAASVASLPALPSPEDGRAKALLVPMLGRLTPSSRGPQCLRLSLPFPPAVATVSTWTWQSPVPACPSALPLPFLWQEQPLYKPRWQNSVCPPLSLPSTSLFGSIFLSLNFM